MVSQALAAPPGNDDFASRQELAPIGLGLLSSSLGASVKNGELFTFHLLSTVWYTWTAPVRANVRLAVDSATFDPVAYCFTGSSFDDLSSVARVFNHQPADFDVTAGM